MDVMDIANLATNMSQAQLMTDISTAVLDMTLDTFEGQANEVVELMESVAPPDLGHNFDISI